MYDIFVVNWYNPLTGTIYYSSASRVDEDLCYVQ
jgi:hypothetical protein